MTQLHLDLHGATHYLTTPWSFGVNVSRAPMLLRKEIQRHLIMGRDEIGFRHVRFSGIFDEAMQVLLPDGSYDFSAVERSLDWLMEQGLTPFVALSGAPAALKADGSPIPGDREKWVDMVRALAAFVDGRYGCDAQEWNFEVWPGADKPAVWNDTPEAFYRFYDLTARAIKSANAHFKVGGASATDSDWTAAFIDHLAQPSEVFTGVGDAPKLDLQRCDFITVSGQMEGVSTARAIADRLSPVRIRLTESLGETTPLYLSSWSRSGSEPSIENDRCAAGGFIADVAAATSELATGLLYDGISDIDQNDTIRYEPFHGGRGLVNVNDIRKASFNAFRLLNEHVGYKMEWRWQEPTEGLSALVTKDYHNMVRILVSYDKVGAKGPAKFTMEGLPESVQFGQVQILRPSAGSALEAWAQSGQPLFINRYVLDDLEAGAHPAMTEVNFIDYPPRLEAGMTLQLTIPLPDDVMTMD